eukprot:4122913-Pyramimonas_sp.AAC.1
MGNDWFRGTRGATATTTTATTIATATTTTTTIATGGLSRKIPPQKLDSQKVYTLRSFILRERIKAQVHGEEWVDLRSNPLANVFKNPPSRRIARG